MRKTDKKLEKGLITALTKVCEQALEEIKGFQWLTHQVNFNDFPRSLRVTCVFETRAQVTVLLDSPLQTFQAQPQDISPPLSDSTILADLIFDELSNVGIYLHDRRIQIKFDSEEACLAEHEGKWNRRLS
jgi:hypothetical protein